MLDFLQYRQMLQPVLEHLLWWTSIDASTVIVILIVVVVVVVVVVVEMEAPRTPT